VAIALGALPRALATADLNGDGAPDLVTADPHDGYGYSTSTVSVALNRRGKNTVHSPNQFSRLRK